MLGKSVKVKYSKLNVPKNIVRVIKNNADVFKKVARFILKNAGFLIITP